MSEADITETLSADRIRWVHMVKREFDPELIVIVDNKSPVPDPLESCEIPNLIHVKLNENAGRSVNSQGQLCGWSQSFLISASIALSHDDSHYVYLEQDCWFSATRERLVKKYFVAQDRIALGHGLNTPYPVQQSIFAIPQALLNRFVFRFCQIPLSDKEMAPELKFIWAGSKLPLGVILATHLTVGRVLKSLKNLLKRTVNEIEFMPTTRGPFLALSYIHRVKKAQGRSRPLNWSLNPTIAQQLSAEDVEKLNFGLSD